MTIEIIFFSLNCKRNPDFDYDFKEGNADCVQTLVKAGANVNSSNAR